MTLPAQLEQEPARQEEGSSMPSSSAWSRMYTSSGHSKDCSPSGVCKVTLKWAATPRRAGTLLTIAGAAPAANAAPLPSLDTNLHCWCTVSASAVLRSCGLVKAGAKMLRRNTAPKAAASSAGIALDWDGMVNRRWGDGRLNKPASRCEE